MSNYIHTIPGRIRLKCKSVKKNPHEAAKVRALLAALPGIQSIDVNLLTGSVLICYNAQVVSENRILWSLTHGGYFEPAKAVTHDDMLHSALTAAGKAVGSLAVGVLEIDNPALALLTALI